MRADLNFFSTNHSVDELAKRLISQGVGNNHYFPVQHQNKNVFDINVNPKYKTSLKTLPVPKYQCQN